MVETELCLTVEARPSVAATHFHEMRMFASFFEQGVKALQPSSTLQSSRDYTPLEIQAVTGLRENSELAYILLVPESQESIVANSFAPPQHILQIRAHRV
ncbi:hypothetical protein L5515_018312 [Caenorhabditis briggsae]|uniref:Uncharacterized protein n=1 Tax=Caenorhabditis briggsae TaxID=6238 RepID=A0AAE9JSR9_CAEBR|nr:hypothetical protein L5515_018312 [Caenorhabditis briggsae]